MSLQLSIWKIFEDLSNGQGFSIVQAFGSDGSSEIIKTIGSVFSVRQCTSIAGCVRRSVGW